MDKMAEIAVWLLTTGVPFVSLYFINNNRIKESENRMTVLEMTVKHMEERIQNHGVRLDRHDEQSRAIYAMVEQVRNLTTTMEEVKDDVKALMKGR